MWIGHRRYPAKGRVWHPGGAHPFAGMHEALVHNGDSANYASISSYLAQHGITSLVLTDTGVAVLVFDLLHRTFGYPLEHGDTIRGELAPGVTIVRDARRFVPEGPESLVRAVVEVYRRGARRIIVHGARGHRFVGCGLGAASSR